MCSVMRACVVLCVHVWCYVCMCSVMCACVVLCVHVWCYACCVDVCMVLCGGVWRVKYWMYKKLSIVSSKHGVCVCDMKT